MDMKSCWYQTIWHHIPRDNNLENHGHEVFKHQKLDCEIKRYSTNLFLKQNIDHIYNAADVAMWLTLVMSLIWEEPRHSSSG
jgi:hypothetical protein